ncbi:MAG: hypothetical protein L0Z53_01245, partial [Acidobacteriales bacterium]|nr:hypothetical protein [Terriglobales bacterium]
MTQSTWRLCAKHGKRAACALVLFAAVFATAATNRAPQQPQRTVRGSVYEDVNANGRRDDGEKGIARVSVSDQASVVLTGEDGGYQLEVAAAASVIFVSVPDGWIPSGSFWRTIDRASSSGTAPVDFALRARPKTSEFTFIHASDTHLSKDSLPRIRRLREIVERERPAFVLITGD